MNRKIMNDLIKWKNNEAHIPLILRGARGVGKTYILKEFGEKYYKNIAYFNFESDKSLYRIFENSKDLDSILEQLSCVDGTEIEKENTLIIFDEIQECWDALFALKYFSKESSYHVVGACSFYPLRISQISFNIAKVLAYADFLNLYPMTFSEFLVADGCENLVEFMKSIHSIENIPKLFEDKLIEKLKIYFIVGGMPEVVYSWVNEKDIGKVNDIQKNILDSYSRDFLKCTKENQATKISLIWNDTPMRLTKEKKNFIYQDTDYANIIKEEDAINWLSDSHLIYKIYNITNNDFPIIKYSDLEALKLDDIKIYINDIGLLRRMSNLDSRIIIEGNKMFEEFNGAFTENYVCHALTTLFDNSLSYFTFDRNEIDFVIEYKNEIIPIEVKSNKNNNSLIKYSDKYNFHKCLIFSINNLKKDGAIINVPLYFIEYIDNIL